MEQQSEHTSTSWMIFLRKKRLNEFTNLNTNQSFVKAVNADYPVTILSIKQIKFITLSSLKQTTKKLLILRNAIISTQMPT